MDNGFHVGPRPIDLGMDEALEKARAPARVDRIAVEIVFEDVACGG